MEISDLEVGDKVKVNERKNPLTVEKRLEPLLDRDRIEISIKGGGRTYAKEAVIIKGPQDGKYHLYEDSTGRPFISRFYSFKTKYDSYTKVESIKKLEE